VPHTPPAPVELAHPPLQLQLRGRVRLQGGICRLLWLLLSPEQVKREFDRLVNAFTDHAQPLVMSVSSHRADRFSSRVEFVKIICSASFRDIVHSESSSLIEPPFVLGITRQRHSQSCVVLCLRCDPARVPMSEWFAKQRGKTGLRLC
jgi:hypothetical protein